MIDPIGNLYVGNNNNSTNFGINKISTLGIVTTLQSSLGTTRLCGMGIVGYNIVYIQGSNSGVYMLNTKSNTITNLAVTTTAVPADGYLTASPRITTSVGGGITAGLDGNLYVSLSGTTSRILKLNPYSLSISSICGPNTTGTVSTYIDLSATVGPVGGLYTSSSGTMYIADTLFNRVKAVNSGVVSTLVGTTGVHGAQDTTSIITSIPLGAEFVSFGGMAMDSNSNLFIVDTGNNRIRMLSYITGAITTLCGGYISGFQDGTGTGAWLHGPTGIAIDSSNNIWFTDTTNNVIRMCTQSGVVTTIAVSLSGSTGSTNANGINATFNGLTGIAFDNNSPQNLYIADTTNNLVRKMSTVYPYTVTTYASGFSSPVGIVLDSFGNVYVGNTGNYKIQKISTTGVVTTIAGTGSTGSTNGNGTSASFSVTKQITIDYLNNLYIADYTNGLIRMLDINFNVTTYITVTASVPTAVFINKFGVVYYNNTATTIAEYYISTGTTTTVAGSGSTVGQLILLILLQLLLKFIMHVVFAMIHIIIYL